MLPCDLVYIFTYHFNITPLCFLCQCHNLIHDLYHTLMVPTTGPGGPEAPASPESP